MKAIRYKTKLLLGFVLFLSGTLMLQMPVYISLDQHFLAHPINLGGNFLILQKIYIFVP